jgi:hypothetical protein
MGVGIGTMTSHPKDTALFGVVMTDRLNLPVAKRSSQTQPQCLI